MEKRRGGELLLQAIGMWVLFEHLLGIFEGEYILLEQYTCYYGQSLTSSLVSMHMVHNTSTSAS